MVQIPAAVEHTHTSTASTIHKSGIFISDKFGICTI